MHIDGKVVAKQIEHYISNQVLNFTTIPTMGIILVGDRPDSELYVKLKLKKCKELGVGCNIFRFDLTTKQSEILEKVNQLNDDETIHGILVQLPLPSHIDEYTIINAVSYNKDIDGFHDKNVAKSIQGNDPLFYSCTPRAILKILEFYEISIQGKLICIVGSGHVGKMVGNLLLKEEATVLFINRSTKNKKELVYQADIVIACCGQPMLIKEDWVKDDAFIIDVGINRIEDSSRKSGYRTVGDVDYENVIKKASVNHLTVGPVTIMILIEQLVKGFKLNYL